MGSGSRREPARALRKLVQPKANLESATVCRRRCESVLRLRQRTSIEEPLPVDGRISNGGKMRIEQFSLAVIA